MPPASPIDSSDTSAHLPGGEDEPSIPETDRDQQCAFEDAAEAIAGGEGACPSDPASFGVEIRNLAEWAKREGTLIPESEVDALPLVSNSTSEHEVFYRADDSRAVKRTWPGIYAVFGGDLRLEGVTISGKPSMIIGQPAGEPSIVISQRWYEKEGVATNEDIHDLLVQEGFRPVPSSYFGWYRPSDGVVIVDAKPDNFIRTAVGLIPIDLQLAIFSCDELLEAGLVSDGSAPIIFIPR
jgi:hypothetical protein